MTRELNNARVEQNEGTPKNPGQFVLRYEDDDGVTHELGTFADPNEAMRVLARRRAEIAAEEAKQ